MAPSQTWRAVVPFALVFLAACWVFFYRLGAFPLFNPDEALYAEPAREMLELGEYITTLLNYDVRFTKPPLVIWAMAFAYRLFGVNEFAARFFCAASGAVLVACTHGFLARYVSVRAAVIGSLSLMTAPLFVGTAREAITDMPLSLFTAGCLMAFFRAYREGSGKLRWVGYFLVGLAVMTKGPVGLVLPAVIVAAYHVLRGDWRQAWGFYKVPAGLAVVVAIALPWFAVEIAITKGAYFQEFIVRENFQRFTSVVDSHKGPIWYHLAAMLGGFFPFSVFVPQAVYHALNVGSMPEPAAGPRRRVLAWLKRFRNLSQPEELQLYCVLWALITLVFYSASVSKLLPYTIPAFPALAVLVAIELEQVFAGASRVRLLAPLALLAIIYGAGGAVAPMALHRVRNAPAELNGVVGGVLAFQCAATMLAIALALFRRQFAAIALFGALTLAATGYFGIKALDILSASWEGPLPGLCRYVSDSGLPIVVFDMRKPSVPFYTHRKVVQPGDEDELNAKLGEYERAYILTKTKRSDYFRDLPGCRVAARDGGFLLVEWARPGS